MRSRAPRGRGSAFNPRNRFAREHFTPAAEGAPGAAAGVAPGSEQVRTRYLRDATRRVLAFNDSPDVPFRASLNAYRGCEHGCTYCYARPTHEFLGFSAGLDFETRILVKHDAPELLRAELRARRWEPQPIAMSGVTDPYQPVERKLELTRRCLQVLAAFRNPVGIVTKNHLVTRDLDVLAEMAAWQGASVHVSITTLDPHLARSMEPRASGPAHRLHAITRLADAGVPVGVMVAPVIPGLTDDELPAILRAAADAGATHASYMLLRLPHAVKDLFSSWLDRALPSRKAKVLSRLRSLRGGKLNETRFGARMSGEGAYARQIADLFFLGRRLAKLSSHGPELSVAQFRPDALEADGTRQLSLFEAV